ncbi:MAG: amidohydrolase family protein, partial [Acidimicrobiales bacterium]
HYTLAGMSSGGSHGGGEGSVLLKAKRLFDGVHDVVLADPILEVDGGRLVGVTHGAVAGAAREPDVDLGDTTLLPGLIDVHQHLGFDASTDPVATMRSDSDAVLLLRMRLAARRALSVGITTIRDLGDRGYLGVALRDWFRSGAEAGPEILASGPPITTTGGHCWFMGGEADGVAGVRQAVRDHVARGVDVIKVMATGGNLTEGSGPHESQYSLEELRAVVDEAHAHHLLLAAHAHGTQGISDSMEAGADSIEHCTFWSEEGVDEAPELVAELGRRRAFVSVTGGYLPGMAPSIPAAAARAPAIRTQMRALRRAGARLVCSTDAGIAPGKPHSLLPYSVVAFAAATSNAEALTAATALAAEACGIADRKGAVVVGLDADLLAVRGNPLEDIDALHDVVAVYTRGRRVPLPLVDET